ncbi:MAG: heat-inducible transcription repressor HrcA [Bacteroidetes bacterium]|nr:heat-inducible transcription repressor HrcA [Bacteroidota bacterium]
MEYETPDIHDLSDRERQVLLSIIEQHVLTASPVGSRTLSKNMEIRLSPASIRNVMADLEERGLIGHPHTSAGRIPTDLGYRYYVDSIMQSVSLSDQERRFIDEHFETSLNSAIQELIRSSSHILSQISHQLAIVSAPSLGQGVLQRIELVPVSTDKIMVILSIRSGIVKSIILHLRNEIVRREQLESISVLLNEQLAGLTLKDIRETFADRVRDAGEQDNGIIRLFIESTDRVFSERLDSDALCIDGMNTVTRQPEFGDPERLRNIIELVENQHVIFHVLDSIGGGRSLTIRIGREINDEKLNEYSIIAAPYRFGQLNGTVSIVGPRRMNYPRMIAIVDYLSKIISQ